MIESYSTGEFDRIEILYNEFKSAVRQDVVLEQFLPFEADEEMKESASQVDYLYEPGKEEIFTAYRPKTIEYSDLESVIGKQCSGTGGKNDGNGKCN